MKTLLPLILTLMAQIAFAEESCPNFQGEYSINACPRAGTTFQTTRVFQPDCRTIGLQTIIYAADGTPNIFNVVRWEPIGAGKLLEREDKSIAYYKEKFFDRDSLYSYTYRVDKATNASVVTRVEIIEMLRDGNIFVAYDVMSPNHTWFNLKNCK